MGRRVKRDAQRAAAVPWRQLGEGRPDFGGAADQRPGSNISPLQCCLMVRGRGAASWKELRPPSLGRERCDRTGSLSAPFLTWPDEHYDLIRTAM
ncbi:hypothetical protein MTO96_013548 [Rhipicephalus appendiculatus]